MRINRFSPAVLIGFVLCTSENDRSFAAGNGDTNENVALTATPEDRSAYEARRAARAAADEGFFLGQRGDFRAAKKKFSQAIELDPKFSPAYQLRAAACMKMSDWVGAIVDLDTLITLDPNMRRFSMSAVSRVDTSAICTARGMTSTDASHSEQILCSPMGTAPKLSSCSAITAPRQRISPRRNRSLPRCRIRR
jgi:tetratricopeptide (TPR) repeat protein